MGWLLLLTSIAMTAVSCRAGMRLFARSAADRYWVRILIVPIHLGAATMITSAFGSFAAGPFLLIQAVLSIVLWIVWLQYGPLVPAPEEPTPATSSEDKPGVDPVRLIMGMLIVALLVASLIHGLCLPMFGYDERMYHASRVAYWLQNQSVLFFETHNDRQVAFPFGGELFFAWPLLFVKNELVGHAFHWAAVPAATFGVWSLCRAIGLGRRASLAGSLVYASTPTVLFLGSGLKSDIWLPVYLLGAAYFVLCPRVSARATLLSIGLAGVMLALAMNVKMTAVALAPGLALVTMASFRPGEVIRRWGALAMGTVAGILLCGLGALLVSNMVHFGRPLGPAWMSRAVQPDYSARQIYVHAARTIVFLLEPPEIPSEGLRAIIERRGNKLAARLHADARLAHEDNAVWPGIFSYHAGHTAVNYSLWGMLWLPTLVIGLVMVAREAFRLRNGPSLSRPARLLVMQAPLFLGVVFMIRWMGDGPSRFWIGAFALAIPLGARNIERWAARSNAIAGLSFLLLVTTALATLRGNLFRLDWFVLHPLSAEQVDGRLHEAIPLIPPGSRVLLIASGATRDYGLFLPVRKFPNRVYPWGQGVFDAAKMEGRVRQHSVTHVLIEHDEQVDFFWGGQLNTQPFAEWAERQKRLEEVALTTKHMRLFRVNDLHVP